MVDGGEVRLCLQDSLGQNGSQMKLLTTKSVPELFSVPAGTLRYWRKVGLGPAWIKLEGSIRYAEDDVLRY